MSTAIQAGTHMQQYFYALQISLAHSNMDFEQVKAQYFARYPHVQANGAFPDSLQSSLTALVDDQIQAAFGFDLGRDKHACVVRVIDCRIVPGNGLTALLQIVVNVFGGQVVPHAQCMSLLQMELRSELSPHFDSVRITANRAEKANPKGENQTFWRKMRSQPIFWSLSGASVLLLRESYTDHNKYKSLGAAILFTGIFAALSMGFALTYVSPNWYVIVPVAILWGLTIINIDMLIVNTMNKHEKTSWKSVFGFLSRLLLGALIAISISIPLEMTILQDEIRDEIDAHDRAKLETEEAKARSLFTDLDEKKKRKDLLQLEFIDEMQGKDTGSGYRGYGQIAQRIEQELAQLNTEIKKLETRKDSTLLATTTEISRQQVQNNKYGFLASFRALHRLEFASEDQSVLWISLGIKLLLLMIELMPILAKSLMARGVYDAHYELEEHSGRSYHDRARRKLSFEEKND